MIKEIRKNTMISVAVIIVLSLALILVSCAPAVSSQPGYRETQQAEYSGVHTGAALQGFGSAPLSKWIDPDSSIVCFWFEGYPQSLNCVDD